VSENDTGWIPASGNLPSVLTDYNDIRDEGIVMATDSRGISVDDRVLTYDGETPGDERCDSCEGVVIAAKPFERLNRAGHILHIRLDWDTWR
jgi:hypothetical protein